MEKQQAGGYIFEFLILRLLKKLKYVSLSQKHLRGRGALHQIDATGIFSLPIPFVYTLRLICEAKYRDKVGLGEIRNFVGVMKDISENYFIKNSGERKQRYTDVGCFFGKDSFSEFAQDYAWAHNIYIVSFSGIRDLMPLVDAINYYLDNFHQGSRNKEETIDDFVDKIFRSNEDNIKKLKNKIDNKNLIVATLNSTYPVIFFANNRLLKKLHKRMDNKESNNDNIPDAIKTARRRAEDQLSYIFTVEILGESVDISLPINISNKIINKILRSSGGQKIFELDIIMIRKLDGKIYRRMLKINTKLG
ncbi:hypothetical protein KAJ61_05495 [Candidatus Parcubacteria bacterium]|nr:hypothetical protein [Candidatus Parcubacteria bacterium]